MVGRDGTVFDSYHQITRIPLDEIIAKLINLSPKKKQAHKKYKCDTKHTCKKESIFEEKEKAFRKGLLSNFFVEAGVIYAVFESKKEFHTNIFFLEGITFLNRLSFL